MLSHWPSTWRRLFHFTIDRLVDSKTPDRQPTVELSSLAPARRPDGRSGAGAPRRELNPMNQGVEVPRPQAGMGTTVCLHQ